MVAPQSLKMDASRHLHTRCSLLILLSKELSCGTENDKTQAPLCQYPPTHTATKDTAQGFGEASQQNVRDLGWWGSANAQKVTSTAKECREGGFSGVHVGRQPACKPSLGRADWLHCAMEVSGDESRVSRRCCQLLAGIRAARKGPYASVPKGSGCPFLWVALCLIGPSKHRSCVNQNGLH